MRLIADEGKIETSTRTLYRKKNKTIQDSEEVDTTSREFKSPLSNNSNEFENRYSAARTSVYKIPSFKDLTTFISNPPVAPAPPVLAFNYVEEPTFQSIDIIGNDERRSIPPLLRQDTSVPKMSWIAYLFIGLIFICSCLVIVFFEANSLSQLMPVALFPLFVLM